MDHVAASERRIDDQTRDHAVPGLQGFTNGSEHAFRSHPAGSTPRTGRSHCSVIVVNRDQLLLETADRGQVADLECHGVSGWFEIFTDLDGDLDVGVQVIAASDIYRARIEGRCRCDVADDVVAAELLLLAGSELPSDASRAGRSACQPLPGRTHESPVDAHQWLRSRQPRTRARRASTPPLAGRLPRG